MAPKIMEKDQRHPQSQGTVLVPFKEGVSLNKAISFHFIFLVSFVSSQLSSFYFCNKLLVDLSKSISWFFWLARWPRQWKGYPMCKYCSTLWLYPSQCWWSSPGRNQIWFWKWVQFIWITIYWTIHIRFLFPQLIIHWATVCLAWLPSYIKKEEERASFIVTIYLGTKSFNVVSLSFKIVYCCDSSVRKWFIVFAWFPWGLGLERSSLSQIHLLTSSLLGNDSYVNKIVFVILCCGFAHYVPSTRNLSSTYFLLLGMLHWFIRSFVLHADITIGWLFVHCFKCLFSLSLLFIIFSMVLLRILTWISNIL